MATYAMPWKERAAIEKELKRVGLGTWIGASAADIKLALDEYERTGKGLLWKPGRYEVLIDYLELVEGERARTVNQLRRWYCKKGVRRNGCTYHRIFG